MFVALLKQVELSTCCPANISIEQLKKVCHYTNIIPMWEDDHKTLHGSDLKKRNKVNKKYNLEKYYKK